MASLIFLLSFFIWSTALGSEPAVNLDGCDKFKLTDPGGSMENVPVRDQGNLGTCYAYTAAAAIDAWRFSADPGMPHTFYTSPHALAIDSKDSASKSTRAGNISSHLFDPNDEALGGHLTVEAVRAAKIRGICSYDRLGAHFDNSRYSKFKGDSKEFWTELELCYDEWHQSYLNTQDAATQTQMAMSFCEELRGTLKKGKFSQDQLSLINLSEALQMVAAQDVFVALKRLETQVCQDQTMGLPPDFPSLPITFSLAQIKKIALPIESRAQVFRRVIDQMFQFKNKQPIMIAFCGPEALDVDQEFGLDQKTAKANHCSRHASLIIGREKMADGTCGYRIRNSWGGRSRAELQQLPV